MSRRKYTEVQIIAALKQVEAGRTMEDVGREYGVSKHTIYAWKAKHSGMEVREAPGSEVAAGRGCPADEAVGRAER